MKISLDLDALSFDSSGLIPAVTQDTDSGQVLMVAWMNRDALTATLESGRATFWSRTRQALWEKGATSGNILEVESITPDCDGDTLLLVVRPTGPACHTGTTSCFGSIEPSFAQLGRLRATVLTRATERPAGSYTTRLLEGGDLAAKKLLEEAGEVAFAVKDLAAGGDRSRVVEEAADLVYHLFVLLTQHEIEPAEIAGVLRNRS